MSKNFIRLIVFAFSLALTASSTWILAQVVGGGGTPVGTVVFPGHGGLRVPSNLVLPQMAVGRDITTTLILMAVDSIETPFTAPIREPEAVRGTIHFFAQDGTPLRVRIDGDLTDRYRFELKPSRMMYLEISAEGSNRSGWALIETEDPAAPPGSVVPIEGGFPIVLRQRLQATVFYTVAAGEAGPGSRVGVVPATYEMGQFFTSNLAAQTGGVDTGVAIVNTSEEDVEVEVRLLNLDGELVAEETLTLAGGHQIARFLGQLFSKPIPDNFQGRLQVSSGKEGIVVLGLLSAQGILTSIPTHHSGLLTVKGPLVP